jgi:hypothetical protein
MLDGIQITLGQVEFTCIDNEHKEQAIENCYHHPHIELGNMIEHTHSQHFPSDRRAIFPSRESHRPASPPAMSDIGSGLQRPLALELDRSRGARAGIWYKVAFFVLPSDADLLMNVATGVRILGLVTADFVLKPPVGD